MEGPVSTSPLQPPHRTMRRRQLSHARSSWSSGGKQGRRWSVDRGKLNRDIPLAPWEHAIHWWLSIISSNTSYIQVINTLQKYDIAQCLFHHLRSRVIGELRKEIEGASHDDTLSVLSLNETWHRCDYNLVEDLDKHPRRLFKTSQELWNAVQCHEFRFSIIRILISVSNVTSLQDCLCNCPNGKKCPNNLLGNKD